MVPRKANTPTLTREQIVAAAITIVDREGLPALTMRRLAAELGVGPMSLYYHVPDKSALYDLILEAVMGAMDFSGDDTDMGAEERLVRLGYALRDALLAHPHAVPIALSRSLRTPDQLRPVERLLGVLFEVGLDPTTAITAVDIIGHYVFGATAAYANHVADTEYHDARGEASPLGRIDPEHFPNLVRTASEAETVGWDEKFDIGLRALIRGAVLDRIETG